MRAKPFTKNYRKQLVSNEIETKENELRQLNQRLDTLKTQLCRCTLDESLLDDIILALDEVVRKSDRAVS